MQFAPRLVFVLHLIYSAIALAVAAFSLLAADYTNNPGHTTPPHYFTIELIVAIVLGLLPIVTAVLLWKRMSLGWWLGIGLDTTVALTAGYIAVSDLICKAQVPIAFNLCLFGIFAFFGVSSLLLAARPSRVFFGVAPTTQQFVGTV
jgi:hypothetical protein